MYACKRTPTTTITGPGLKDEGETGSIWPQALWRFLQPCLALHSHSGPCESRHLSCGHFPLLYFGDIFESFLLLNLFSVTLPETNTKNPTQSFILTILAQHVLTIWPWSRAVRTLFELSFQDNWFLCWRKSCLLLVSGLLIFSAQLVSLGGSRAAHGARIPGVPLLILAPSDHPSNYQRRRPRLIWAQLTYTYTSDYLCDFPNCFNRGNDRAPLLRSRFLAISFVLVQICHLSASIIFCTNQT